MRICCCMFAVYMTIVGCVRSEPPRSLGGGETQADKQHAQPRDPLVRDEESIIGFWKVVEASVDGDPYPEQIGTIYEFRRGNTLRFVSSENEGLQEYRMDAKKRPKTLVMWFFDPEIASCGIYDLSSNALRWRFAREKQELQFSDIPHGTWWEYMFVRITADEAGPAIKAIQDRRLESSE